MSVVTDTTNHENGIKGDSRIAPTGDWPGVIFRGMTGVGVLRLEYLMRVVTLTTWNEYGGSA